MTVIPPEQIEPPPQRSKKAIAALLMGGALAGKLLGFVREIIFAQVVGVALLADGFRTATTAILLPLAFLQNESVPGILVPMMKDGQAHGDSPQRLARLSIALTSIGILLMVAMLLFGHLLVNTMVAGFSAEGRELTLHLVRIMSLAMPASVLLNCLAAGELAIGRTRIMNLRASVLNVGVIIGLGMLVATGYSYALGWAFSAAFNLLGAWGTWRLVKEGNLSFSGITVRQVLATAKEFLHRLKPFLLLPGAEQANVWLERFFASRIVTGAVASLDYARTLTDSAFLLFSQPIGMAFLADNRPHDEKEQIQSIARPLLAVAIPFAAFTYLFAEDIVRLIFHRGAFGEHGVLLTSQALSGIALGMWASTLGWVLLRLLNRSGRNTVAAFILIGAYTFNICLNVAVQNLAQGSGMEVFLLGVGEATRGLVLLLGVALALGCSTVLLRLILIALAPTVIMAVCDWQLEQIMPASFERLVLGGMIWAVCTFAALWLLCPAVLRLGFSRLRAIASRKEP